jgi:hypothetical protein
MNLLKQFHAAVFINKHKLFMYLSLWLVLVAVQTPQITANYETIVEATDGISQVDAR